MRTLTAAEITALLACPVMRVRQAEAIFKINRNRLYEMMREGTLPYVMIGSARLIRTDVLQSMTTPQSDKAA